MPQHQPPVMLNALTRKSKGKSKALVEEAESGVKDADSPVKTVNTDVSTDKGPSSSPTSNGGGAVCRVKHKKSHKKTAATGSTGGNRPGEEAATRARSASSRRSCSTVVTFESIQPTQVWQASASPSPPASLKGDLSKYRRNNKSSTSCAGTESLTLSMIARAAECQWISAESTEDEEEEEEDAIDTSDDWGTSKSNSMHHHHHHRPTASPSCRRPAAMTKSGSLSVSSDSSPTSSASSVSSLDIVGRRNDKSEKCRQPPNFGPSSSKRCDRGGKRGAKGSSHRRKHRRSPVLSSSSSSSSSLSDPDNESDFSWMARALKFEASAGGSLGPIGFVPHSICRLPSDHVRRIPFQEALVRLSPRHISQDAVSHHSDCASFMTTSQQFRSDLGCAIVSESVSMSEHSQLRVYPSPVPVSAAGNGVDVAAQQASKTVFGSGASIAGAVYEIEDRDSGRGPSSGSEWSSGKGGSLSGATDLNADEKIDQPPRSPNGPSTNSLTCSSPPYPPQHWGVRSPADEPHERRASLDHSIYVGFTGPLPPPPMVLLTGAVSNSGVQKTETGLLSPNTSQVSSMSDTESPWSTTVNSKLYVRPLRTGQSLLDRIESTGEQVGKTGDQMSSREPAEEDEEEEGNGSPTTVVVPSNSDPTYWEPYKTMIQVGQNKLEKFTLV
ncbi:unnamed protein product [Schistocephalus solidus]|uniref:Uncharacterized protein n=1 Tax=Schistocephalus solidus TaxID=70667 RepID=A0A3P7D595_SCHSO|nr:unnamed protein product [Schistocephalus solidus]